MKVFSIILLVILVGFFVYQLYATIKTFINRKKMKISESKDINIEKEGK